MSSAAIATLIGAVIAFGASIYGFFHVRKITAQKTTLEFILRYEIHSPRWLQSLKSFSVVAPEERIAIIRKKGTLAPNERQVLLGFTTVLNHYEMVAIAIERKIIDEAMYKNWFRQSYVHIWRKAESSVSEWRLNKEEPKAFIKFEQLAQQWDNEIKQGQ